MRFIANENFPSASVKRLRDSGYEVIAVAEETPVAEDKNILSWANHEKRIILTFDRDYGELIYKLNMPVQGGVICFRFNPPTPLELAEYVLQLLSEGILFVGVTQLDFNHLNLLSVIKFNRELNQEVKFQLRNS